MIKKINRFIENNRWLIFFIFLIYISIQIRNMRSNLEDVWNWVADIADYSRETKNEVNYLHDDVLDVLKDIKINTLF